ncbi:MAG: carbohydrate ABC transporter substrate-binding protein [Lachnospiraceae bacterium]|nr:carbohydrate ABC transporter substrate-binding protein [Lachnospiraceae bacterium]
MKRLVYIVFFVLIMGLTGCKHEDVDKKPLTIMTTSINYEKFVEAFQEKYPDIEIEFISYKGFNQTGYIRECFEAGELPDIVTTTSFVDKELQKNRLLDLSKYSFVNNYTDYWLNKCNVNGSIYLVPSNYSAIGFYYNKTIMERYGWELPNNFEELKELSIKIEEAGLNTCVARMDLEGFIFSDLFGLGNTFYFNTEEGAKWKKEFLEGKADASGNIEPVLSYFEEWVDAGFISPNDIDVKGVADSFYTGETVFMLCNGLSFSNLEFDDIGKMEYGILPWLSPSGNSNMIVSNVSRYYGLNKKLEEAGQEERLQDALCFMEFMASEEGMKLLTTNTNTISPLNTWEINESDMYYEIKDTINGGNSVSLVYTGWDDLIIPFANELYALMRKEQTIEECAKQMDIIRDKWIQNGPKTLAYVEEEISKEDTAYLVGKIFLETKRADAALISLGDFHGYEKENINGIQCGIYPGDIHLDRMRTIVPVGNMGIVLMSGKEILKRQREGLYLYPSSEEDIPFEYVLVTDKNMELKEEEMYSVIIAVGELLEEEQKKVTQIWGSADSQIIMETYFSALKENITKETIYNW